MAEFGPETSRQPSPFHIEAMILAKEESTTSEKRLQARFLKDVKIKERDSKQPMDERPVLLHEVVFGVFPGVLVWLKVESMASFHSSCLSQFLS